MWCKTMIRVSTCKNCGNKINQKDKFCPYCGETNSKPLLTKNKLRLLNLNIKKVMGLFVVTVLIISLFSYINNQRVENSLANPDLYWEVSATGASSIFRVEKFNILLSGLKPLDGSTSTSPKIYEKCVFVQVEAHKNINFNYLGDSYDQGLYSVSIYDFKLNEIYALNDKSSCRELGITHLSMSFNINQSNTAYIAFKVPDNLYFPFRITYKDEEILIINN